MLDSLSLWLSNKLWFIVSTHFLGKKKAKTSDEKADTAGSQPAKEVERVSSK